MSHRTSLLALVLGASSCCALLAYTGCVGDAAVTPGTDAGTDAAGNPDVNNGNDTGTDGSPSDGPVEAGPACNLLQPFDPPKPVVELNTPAAEDAARISPNGLELYVMREDAGLLGKRQYRYTRTSPQAPWVLDAVQPTLSVVAAGSANPATGSMSLSPDAKTAYFSVFMGPNGGPWHLYFSTRSAVGQPWGTPAAVTGLVDTFSNEIPWLNATGDRLYFQANHGAGIRIYASDKGGNGFATANAIGAIRNGEDRAPVLSTDELTIYFAAYEVVGDASAAMGIYKATRAKVGDTFTQSSFVTELNVPGVFSSPTWLSPDGCEIYLTSQRAGGGDIYSARKPK